MRIIVDELPKSTYECLFRGWALGRQCLFGDGKCKDKCPYLKLIDTPITMKLTGYKKPRILEERK